MTRLPAAAQRRRERAAAGAGKKRTPQQPGTRSRATTRSRREPKVPLPSAEARARMVDWLDTKILRYHLDALREGLDAGVQAAALKCFGRDLEPEERNLLVALVWQLRRYEGQQRLKAPEKIEPRHVDWAEARLWAVDMHVRSALSGATAEQRAALLRALSESDRLQVYLRDNAIRAGKGNKTRRDTDLDILPVIAARMERLFNIADKAANQLVRAALKVTSNTVRTRRAKARS